ncbi:LysR family transcriptional regulator [Aliikangiella sp. G2MR2-5]|uniref:LysR family transcriptional regulator n=1 Tax=Aliikangiella sp. G2MR2-5 TaxID=2788943 RepID=UPI0018AB2EC8|nr:LysR family transcriptional regulator [Aliikangiella sp. G2MR2-5]
MKDVNWDDLKAAYRIAAHGSIALAATDIGVNYSTLLRRIDRLERSLGIKLFIRHQRGYKLTDSGKHLLVDMPAIEQKLDALQSRIVSEATAVAGMVRITTLPEYSSFLHPILRKTQESFPDLKVSVDVSDEIIPLESGQAHISIRAGKQPDQPDLIAIKISEIKFKYYMSKDYLTRFGMPAKRQEFDLHQWVMPSGKKRNLSFVKRLIRQLNPHSIRYQSNSFFDVQLAIENGFGIGPVDEEKACHKDNLVQVPCIKESNDNSLWFVFHRELREDRRIQAIIRFGKQYNRKLAKFIDIED